MVAVASLVTVVALGILISRIAVAGLMVTGLSQDIARFQARSAYYGVGFTTTESEDVVNDPGRRRIIMTLALLGNAGVATTIASLMLSFTGASRGQAATRVAVIVAAFVVMALLAHSGRLDRYFVRLAQRALRRWTNLELRDYARLLGVRGGFTVGQLRLHPDDWLTERPLRELDLPEEGVQVLGVIRADGDYVGVPDGDTLLSPGDTVVLYGHTDRLSDLDVRRSGRSGDEAHRHAVTTRTSRDDN
jgi:hypothetical protein